MSVTDELVPFSSTSSHSEYNAVQQNTSSVHDNCIRVVFSEMEFLPWDNPDNIVSAEVEALVFRIKNNLLVLLFMIGGPANVINMAVFYKHGLWDRVNLCLFALSLADELYLAASMLLHGEQLYLQFTSKERFGPVYTSLVNRNMIVLIAASYISQQLSAIIATERCLCVYNPLRFQTLLRTRTMAIIIIMVSLVSTGLFFIVSFRYRVGCVYDPTLGITITTFVEEASFYLAHKELIDYMDSVVFGAGLPVVAMLVVTTTTVMTIVKLRQTVTWRAGTSSSISLKELALTKILVGSSILFIACICPVAFIPFSCLFVPEMTAGGRHHNLFLVCFGLFDVFSLINSTFNFLVYYVMGSRYRATFWSLFSKKKGKEQTTSQQQSKNEI